jgi:hypothetical protein
MEKSIRYIGLDVHKQTIAVAVADAREVRSYPSPTRRRP